MLLYREAPLTQQKLDNKTSDDTTSVDERLNESKAIKRDSLENSSSLN